MELDNCNNFEDIRKYYKGRTPEEIRIIQESVKFINQITDELIQKIHYGIIFDSDNDEREMREAIENYQIN